MADNARDKGGVILKPFLKVAQFFEEEVVGAKKDQRCLQEIGQNGGEGPPENQPVVVVLEKEVKDQNFR